MNLTEDVEQTVEKIQCLISNLRARHPEEPHLLIHIAYNWRVAQLLGDRVAQLWGDED